VNLAAIPSPTTAVWDLGPLPIRAYALFIVLGIVAACAVTEVRMRRRGAPPYLVLDIAVVAVPAGIVGARLYHVITSPDSYFGKGGHPLDALKIWHGGLGIWGAVAGGVLGGWIVCRMRGIPLSYVADAAAPGLPLAQAIGRWGNWFNNELYGRPTSLPWGLRVHVMDDNNPGHALMMDGKPVVQEGLFQPTFLYESLWDVGVAILVWQLDKRYRFGRGRAFALYAMAYTAGRAWTEALRIDTAHHFLGLRLNDWTSIVVFLGALAYFVLVRGPQQRLVAGEDGQLTAVPVDGAEPGAGGQPAGATGDPELSGGAEPSGGVEPPGDLEPGGGVEPGGDAGSGGDAGPGSGEPDDEAGSGDAVWRADGPDALAEPEPEAPQRPDDETARSTAEK
jgi:prolipoprotein diacylglyceryl transferase